MVETGEGGQAPLPHLSHYMVDTGATPERELERDGGERGKENSHYINSSLYRTRVYSIFRYISRV
jgi:hypothetical protein